jgi:hypothetical protein
VFDKLVNLLSSLIEGSGRSRGEFGGVVLAFASFGSTPFFGAAMEGFKFSQLLGNVHEGQ